jgi:hypothetical protein
MTMRKFLQFTAILLSSFLSLITHGKAQLPVAAKARKGELARQHRDDECSADDSGDAGQDPPRAYRRHATESDDVKNSTHAAVWTSYMDQESTENPPTRLDRSVMAGAERDEDSLSLSSIAPAPAPPPLPGDEMSRYPWKRGIVTTTFWVGEDATANNPVPNRESCWDPNWARNYGGDDPPDAAERTKDYIPATFVPRQNPFYIALPYNDMEHGVIKAEAAQVIPWFPRDYQNPTKSVCRDHWVAIRFNGKICYAQWEDAGPFSTDHWEYVFGSERPRPNLNHGAGLDVSPAVRDFLGMDSTDVTDWKFVDFDEVPKGPWATYGENNTFVQISRKANSAVVELNPNRAPAGIDEIAPHVAPNVEVQ